MTHEEWGKLSLHDYTAPEDIYDDWTADREALLRENERLQESDAIKEETIRTVQRNQRDAEARAERERRHGAWVLCERNLWRIKAQEAEARLKELEALLSEVLQIAGPQKYRRRRLIKLARHHFAALSPQSPQEVSRE